MTGAVGWPKKEQGPVQEDELWDGCNDGEVGVVQGGAKSMQRNKQ